MGKYLSSKSALNEISSRLKAYRVDYPLSQRELSDKSGVALRSISRMENGEDIQFGNLIKVLIALDLDDNLDMLVPNPKKKPSYYLKDRKNETLRERVKKTKINKKKSGVVWGDEKQ